MKIKKNKKIKNKKIIKPIEPFLEGANKLVDNYMKQLSFVTKESTVEREKATNFYIQKYEKNHGSVTPD